MPSHITSTPPPGGSSLDISSATPSTVIDATGRLRLDDSLDSSMPYSPGCGLDTSSFNGTGALADSSAMSASPRGANGDDPSSLLSSPSSSMASGREGRGSGSGTGRGGHTTAFEKPISTKVFYNVDDEATPYVTQVDVPPEHVTLEDFKRVLTRTNYKFYCKTVDPECGVEVKKELLEDHKHLERSANGNFELYLITIEGSTHSEGSSQHGARGGVGPRHHMQVPGPAPAYPNMYARGGGGGNYFDSTMSTESDSMISDGRPPFLPGKSHHLQASNRYRGGPPPVRHNHHYDFNGHRGRGAPGGGRYDDSTLGSESDARVFSDEDDRGSMSTDLTSVSRQHEKMLARRRKAQRTYHRRPSRASSFSSITESSMSLHVETVTLNMDTVNFLGISIVGQSSARGDNGIYVANVMKGGAVALDGRIEPGDMILQVNEVAFENFTNDQAVDVLRDAVERKGTIRLTVAKSIDSNQRSCFTVPRPAATYNTRDEPVRPIDTGAWIQHTNAMRGMPSILEGSEGAPTPLPGERLHHHQQQMQQRPATSSSATSTGSNGQNTVVGSAGLPSTMQPLPRLDVHTDKRRVVEVMTRPGSGLDIKNRTWLKISIPMSFLGSDLVEWLLEHVSGLRERKEARKYATELLRQRLIAHVVNKISFTEQCYYVLGEQCADFARYRTVQVEEGGVNGGGGTQPTWQWGGGGPRPTGITPGGVGGSMVSGYASMPMSPHPPLFVGASAPGVRTFGGEGSQISSTDGSGSSDAHRRGTRPVVLPQPPVPGCSSVRLDEAVPHDVAASRQSFRIAMNNPYEFFVDNL